MSSDTMRRLASSSYPVPTGLAGAAVASASLGWVTAWSCIALALWVWAWPGPRSRLAALPPAALSLALSVVLLGLGANLLGFSLSGTGAARLALICVTLPPLVLVIAQLESDPRPALVAEWAAALPALTLLLLAAAARLLPGWYQTDWLLLGNDSLEHVLYVGKVQQNGSLSYMTDAYPTGVHQFIALLVSAEGGRPRTPMGLLGALQVTASFTWCVYAVLTLATGLAAVSLAQRLGLSRPLMASSGAAAGGVLLTGAFFTFSMAFGFVTTAALAAVLAVALAELARLEPADLRVLLSCAALAAHIWQLGWPLLPLAVLLAVLPYRLGALRSWRLWWGGAAALLVSSPALIAVSEQVPLSVVAEPGAVADLSVSWAASGLGAALWWTWRERSDPGRSSVGTFVLGCFAFALLVGLRAGDPLGYYPRKLLWHALVLAAPLVCVASAGLLEALLRRAERSVEIKHTAPVLFIALALFAISPLMAASGGWTRSDGVLQQIRRDAPHGQSVVIDDSTAQPTVLGRLREYYRHAP